MVLKGHEAGREQRGCLDRSVQAGQGGGRQAWGWEPSRVTSMNPEERGWQAFFPDGM